MHLSLQEMAIVCQAPLFSLLGVQCSGSPRNKALSTAQPELTAIVEGLQSGRSVRALVELLMANVDLELYNDNRAAVVLAVEGGGQDT